MEKHFSFSTHTLAICPCSPTIFAGSILMITSNYGRPLKQLSFIKKVPFHFTKLLRSLVLRVPIYCDIRQQRPDFYQSIRPQKPKLI